MVYLPSYENTVRFYFLINLYFQIIINDIHKKGIIFLHRLLIFELYCCFI